jgi:hypothetical protein
MAYNGWIPNPLRQWTMGTVARRPSYLPETLIKRHTSSSMGWPNCRIKVAPGCAIFSHPPFFPLCWPRFPLFFKRFLIFNFKLKAGLQYLGIQLIHPSTQLPTPAFSTVKSNSANPISSIPYITPLNLPASLHCIK